MPTSPHSPETPSTERASRTQVHHTRAIARFIRTPESISSLRNFIASPQNELRCLNKESFKTPRLQTPRIKTVLERKQIIQPLRLNFDNIEIATSTSITQDPLYQTLEQLPDELLTVCQLLESYYKSLCKDTNLESISSLLAAIRIIFHFVIEKACNLFDVFDFAQNHIKLINTCIAPPQAKQQVLLMLEQICEFILKQVTLENQETNELGSALTRPKMIHELGYWLSIKLHRQKIAILPGTMDEAQREVYQLSQLRLISLQYTANRVKACLHVALSELRSQNTPEQIKNDWNRQTIYIRLDNNDWIQIAPQKPPRIDYEQQLASYYPNKTTQQFFLSCLSQTAVVNMFSTFRNLFTTLNPEFIAVMLNQNHLYFFVDKQAEITKIIFVGFIYRIMHVNGTCIEPTVWLPWTLYFEVLHNKDCAIRNPQCHILLDENVNRNLPNDVFNKLKGIWPASLAAANPYYP